MMYIIIISGLVALLAALALVMLARAARNAPVGYEDDSGFHAGSKAAQPSGNLSAPTEVSGELHEDSNRIFPKQKRRIHFFVSGRN